MHALHDNKKSKMTLIIDGYASRTSPKRFGGQTRLVVVKINFGASVSKRLFLTKCKDSLRISFLLAGHQHVQSIQQGEHHNRF